MLPAQPNESLIDGIACLQAVAVQGRPVGVRELARLLDLEPTRVNRLLMTLAHLGFTRQNAERKYEPGPGMHVLFAQGLMGSSLFARARPALERLHAGGCAVALGVLWRDQVCYVYHARPGVPFADGIGRMGLYPASRSSIGLVLLAAHGDREVRAIYRQQEIPGFASIADLLAELKTVRALGQARAVTTEQPFEATVAVPVGEPVEAALALFGDLPPHRDAGTLALLRESAAAIAQGAAPAVGA